MMGEEPWEIEVLTQYSDWLKAVAISMRNKEGVTGPDDLVQEGYIAMWNALKSFDPMKGQLDYWLKFKARGAMNSYLTKHKAERGLVEEATEFDTSESEQAFQIDYDGIELAYHEGEICAAVSRLSPQQQKYVQLRFWDGLKGQELVKAFGYDPQALWSSSRNGAKKKLRGDLAHLSGAA